jgi:hypothetical protein
MIGVPSIVFVLIITALGTSGRTPLVTIPPQQFATAIDCAIVGNAAVNSLAADGQAARYNCVRSTVLVFK